MTRPSSSPTVGASTRTGAAAGRTYPARADDEIHLRQLPQTTNTTSKMINNKAVRRANRGALAANVRRNVERSAKSEVSPQIISILRGYELFGYWATS